MERRLKERLVGATLLLGLIIAVVPEMLSGPATSRVPPPPAASPPQPVRHVTVDLTTARSTPLDDEPSAASSAAASSALDTAPVIPPDAKASQVPPTIATLKAQESSPPPLENATPSPNVPLGAGTETAHPRWAIQLGSFANRGNAEKLVHRLKAHASEAYLSPIGKGALLRYRVRIGPFADRGAAEQAMSRLRKEGEAASLVAP
jgi:DedD protein